ncbi:MAG: hypothetical protein IPM35_32940 [Myxococcales bacterium]|nr:hypothetical protein [Myxococcales bacterium]
MPTRSRARRRRQRGAAMVEAAVVAAFMVVMLACVWAALRYQATKIRVMDQTRLAVWQTALGACEGYGDTLADIGETADQAGTSLPSTKQADQFAELGATSLAKDSGYADVTSEKMVTFPKLIGGKSYEMKSRMYVRCNEPAPPENAKDFFMTAVGVAKYLYDF